VVLGVVVDYILIVVFDFGWAWEMIIFVFDS
jgi:hypothetical protein